MLSLSKKLSLTTQPIYRFVNEHSVDFDGVDDRIITDGEVVQYEHATYSFWCKSSETGFNAGVFGHGANNQGAFHFNWNSGRPLLYLGASYYRFWDANDAQDDGDWHHWVVYICKSDITNSKLWVDGVLQTVNTDVLTGSFSAYTETLTIGSDQQSGGNSFEGKIDEFAVYDRELTQAEITRMYNSGTPINLNLNASAYQSANPLITSTKSMEFDATDDYLQLNEPFSHTNHTITGWFKTDVTNHSQEIFSSADNAIDCIRVFFDGSGVLRYRIGNGSTVHTLSSSALDANRWYNFACTYDGTTQTIYVDGVSVSQAASISIDVTTNVTIGKIAYTDSNYFDGKITEVGAYNRALTALEVASLYNQGMPTNLLVNRNNYQSGNPTVFNTKQVDFDGVDDYMIANSTLGSMTGSVSMWVKRGSNTTLDFLVEFRGLGGTGAGFVYLINNSSTIQVSSGTVYVDGVAGTTISVGNWHHIVVTGMTIDITESVLFGRQYPSAHYLDGDMSQVGLWNSTLTADEVSSLYNHGLPIDLTTDQAAYESSSNLVGYWRMGSGTLDTYPLIADQTNATLGSELVTNGDFATDSDWSGTGSNGYSISSGKLNLSDTPYATNVTQANVTTIGKIYKVTFEISNYVKGSVRIFLGGGVTSSVNSDGTYTFYVTASANTSAGIQAISGSGTTLSIDNVSVKQVNGNPAIMTNQTSSDIENGSPYANLIQNTNFTDSSQWSVAGWNITNNQAVLTGTGAGNNLFIGNILELNKTYNIFVDAEISAGSFTVMLGGGGDGYSTVGTISSTGTHTVTGKNISTTSNTLLLQSQSGSTPNSLKINSVTLAEVNTGLQGYWKMGDGTNDEYPVIYDQVDPTLGSDEVANGTFATDSDWTKTGSWVIENGLASCSDASGQFNYLTNTNRPVLGKTYKLTFTVSNYVSGGVVVRAGSVNGVTRTANGTYTEYVTTLDTEHFRARSINGFVGSIDNFTAQLVNGNPATMTNMVEGNITNIHPLTKIRNYYRMGDGILDGYPIIQDQTSPNLAHIPTTNLITYSEDFSNSYWNKDRVSVVSGQLSPSGDTSAYKLVEDTSLGVHRLRTGVIIHVTAGITNTYSIHVKAAERTKVAIREEQHAGKYAVFNLSNKTIISNTGITANIITLNDDWLRINFSQSSGGSLEKFSFFLLDDSYTSGSPSAHSYTGDGTSGVFIYGIQLEEQSQATAYLKSDGIAAVRKSSTTNLVPYSEDFSQWNKEATVTLTPNYSTSPIGTNNATRVQLDADDSVYLSSLGSSKTFSIYVKGIAGKTIRISNGVANNFTLTGNWDRLQVYDTSGSSTTISINTYSSVTARDIQIWGGQLEDQTQAETYAKTTGLPVTIDLFTENNYGTMTNMSASDIVEDTP